MAQKLGMLFSVAAFLVAWLSGLAAGVPPGAILKRSLFGAAGFYLLALVLCQISGALLGFPGSGAKPDVAEEAEEDQNDTTPQMAR
jgi:hypothetical protein